METGNSIIMRKHLDLFFRIFLFSNLGIIDRQCAICTRQWLRLLNLFLFLWYIQIGNEPHTKIERDTLLWVNSHRVSLSIFVRWLIAYLYMISCLPGPFDTIVIGTSNSFSINSMYLRQFSGSLSYSVIPLISSFHPGSTL